MEGVFERLREIEEETRLRLKTWDAESITPTIKSAVADILNRFPHARVPEYLAEVESSLITNVELFKNQKKEEERKEQAPADPLLEYRVNLLVDNGDLKHSPVIMETNPNYLNLFGSIESTMNRFGVLQTDFTKIKAGSFLKANGGYLVVNALDALIEPGVWATLKRTLRNQVFEIQNYAALFLFSSARLKPRADPDQRQGGHDRRRGRSITSSTPTTRTSARSSRSRPSSTPRWPRATTPSRTTSASSRRSARRTRCCPSTGRVWPPSSSTGPASPAGTRSSRPGSTSSPTSSASRATGPARTARPWSPAAHVEQAVRERFERVSLIEDKMQEMIEEAPSSSTPPARPSARSTGWPSTTWATSAFGKPSRITARDLGRPGRASSTSSARPT